MSKRLSLYKFSDIDNAFVGLAFTSTNGKKPRFNSLANILQLLNNLGCKAIIKQYPVQDSDYYAEYSKYYSKTFASIDKYCHRLHFFSTAPLDNEDSLDYIDRVHVDNSSDYLGFMTIRPIRSSPVAATIIRPPAGNHFVLAHEEFLVHLAGRTFSIRATPFMQQDNAVGACAQASIWMALRTLRKREGNSAFDPAQITSAATRFLTRGRTLPNREGLSVEQIIEAVRFAGYSSHIIWLKGHSEKILDDALENAKRKIYTYVESEIPVILGLFPPSPQSGHAVVLIGHGWDATIKPNSIGNYTMPHNSTLNMFHSVSWVNDFYIHNDNTGPYLKLKDRSDQDYALEQAVFAVPLLPSDVFITGEEAEATSLEVILQMIKEYLETKSAELLQVDVKPVVVRTYLSERYRFREWVAKNASMADILKRYYREKEFPKRIWITEICLLDNYAESDKNNANRIGEVILDPTGEPNDTPFLSAHINVTALLGKAGPGILVDRSSSGEAIEVLRVDDDTVYPALCRN
ncbi:hypothetical protein [Methylotenera sp.]|uniref:hypothetical protein n=1 Tax=Methylotenera sp. TaxID=2051956 RepID=UPI002ED8D035